MRGYTYTEAPDYDVVDFVSIWRRDHVARKAGRVCACCRELIEPGQRYEALGYIYDGEFKNELVHFGAYSIAGCPKHRHQEGVAF